MVVQKASKPAFDRQQSYKVESRLTGGFHCGAPVENVDSGYELPLHCAAEKSGNWWQREKKIMKNSTTG